MPLSRIARTHLVYQFIILSLVFFGVGYHELVLAQKFALLLLVVPAFLYQMLVLSCCTELIPVPSWMDFSEASADSNQEQNIDVPLPREIDHKEENGDVPATMPSESNYANDGIADLKAGARKYKLRNWKSSNLEASNLNRTISVVSPDKPTSPRFISSSSQMKSPEPTKKYFFPYRQKRLEQWIEPNEHSRPLKIRNWQSSISIPEHSLEFSDASELAPIKDLPDSSIPDVCPTIPEPELMKRYTFPFRQKHSVESEDDGAEISDECPSTPYWKTVGYSVAVKQEARKRRRSVSSSLLTNRKFDRGHPISDKFKDFSQSVEIPRASLSDFRGTTTASSTTFSKMKSSLVNCFSKIKRVNSKNGLNKGLGKKRRSLKSLFQSRENIDSESSDKESASKSKIGLRETKSEFYPSYIPFQKERFEKDVLKRMSELPQN